MASALAHHATWSRGYCPCHSSPSSGHHGMSSVMSLTVPRSTYEESKISFCFQTDLASSPSSPSSSPRLCRVSLFFLKIFLQFVNPLLVVLVHIAVMVW
ncbi:hypothetical protein BDR04DRAFT_822923 [Suillus decipiens]|nr:hypothetical protein BDR04DRAFT_822923 [Suillus decipiens]